MKEIITALILFSFATIYASEKSISLSKFEAVEYAIENNSDLKAVKIGIEAAKSKLYDVGRLSNPSLNIQYGNDMMFANNGEYKMNVGVFQKFPLTGRLSKEKNIAKIDILLAESEYMEACRNLSLKVELIYLDCIAKKRTLENNKEILKIMNDTISFMKSANKVGEISLIDINQVSQDISKLEMQIMIDEVNLLSFIMELKAILNISENIQILLKDSLSANAEDGGNFSSETLDARPDYQMFKLAADNASAQVALIKANKYEEIEVGIYYEGEKTSGDSEGRYNSIGLAVSIPLPFKSYDGTINEKLAMRRQAESRATSKEIQIKNEIALYKMRSEKFLEVINKYQDSLESSAKKSFLEYESAYKIGQVEILQVFKAKQNLSEINEIRTNLLLSYAQNLVRLNNALGNIPKNLDKGKSNEK